MHAVPDDTQVKPPIPAPPHDPRLPTLALLLDRAAMSERWADHAGPGTRVRIRRVTYVPSIRCEVTYAVDGPAGDFTAVATATAPGRTPDPGSPAGFDADLGAVVRRLPDDPALPQLAALPADMPRVLAELGLPETTGTPHVLGYRSGDRAVLAVADVVIKVYRREADLNRAVAGFTWAVRAIGDGAPRLLAVDRLRRLTVQERIDGRQLDHADCADAVPAAADLLIRLHRCDAPEAPRHTAIDVLAHVAVAARLVRAIHPELARRVDDLAGRLRATAPPRNGTVSAHGDFNVSQMIQTPRDTVALLDFDEHAVASPSLDLAAYAANATSGRRDDAERARTVLEGLAVAYGTRPADLSWYVAAAILCRAPSPFRLQKRSWPERTERIVAAAEDVLR